MAYRKSTLRQISLVTRKVAKLIDEAQSVSRRLKLLLPEIQELEAKDIERKEQAVDVVKRLRGEE